MGGAGAISVSLAPTRGGEGLNLYCHTGGRELSYTAKLTQNGEI